MRKQQFLSWKKISFPADSLNFIVVSDIGLTDIGLGTAGPGIGLIRYWIKIPLVQQIFISGYALSVSDIGDKFI
jgi:hypothetical protein